jgi:FkbM family methyltransferase
MVEILTREVKTVWGSTIQMHHRKDTNDSMVIEAVMEADEYGAKNINYNDGDVFIDLGSHLATWAILMAIKNPTFKVYAFEAIPDNFELMKQNIALNNLTNVYPFNLAVSDVSDVITKIYHNAPSEDYFVTAHRFIGTLFSPTEVNYYETPSISLRDIFLRNNITKVKVIKTDCEGCELKGFPTLTPEMLQNIGYVVGEYHAYGMSMEDFYGIFKPYFDRTDPHGNDLQNFVFKNKGV